MKQVNQPILFVFMGLPASGKSTLAKAWSQRHQFSCFNSDVVRKQLAGNYGLSRQTASYGEGIYASEMTARTYNALLNYAMHELVAGRNIVLDASYGSKNERKRLVRLADKIDAGLCFVSCYCSEKETRVRLAKRATDTEAVSDADWEVFRKKRKNLEPADDIEALMLISINTENDLEQLLEQLDAASGIKNTNESEEQQYS